jgi:tetratricopeptide (TPR) repeat protein
MWDKAIEQYTRILNASGSMDPAIDEAITELMVAKYDEQINNWKAYVKTNPDKQADADTNIALYEQQKQDMLFNRMVERVQRYPNDAAYRFGLGEIYFQRGQFDKAIGEFQLSQKSAQYRIRALAFMGKCTMHKGLLEMAIEQFKAALEGFEKTDPMRKECLYDIACSYEKLNQHDPALNAFRELYAIDVNFKDTSAKLERYYKKT